MLKTIAIVVALTFPLHAASAVVSQGTDGATASLDSSTTGDFETLDFEALVDEGGTFADYDMTDVDAYALCESYKEPQSHVDANGADEFGAVCAEQ